MHIMRSFEARMPMRQVYRPGLCVVIQGAKEILFGEETFRYGVMECLAIGLDLPASGRVIEASADAPYIGITIDLAMKILREVLGQLETPPALGRATCRERVVQYVKLSVGAGSLRKKE